MNTRATTRRIISQKAILPGVDGALTLSPATIDIAGSLIASVTLEGETPPPLPEGVPIDDLGERLLSPAFIDAHTHVSLSCLRGYTPQASAEHNLVEAVFYNFESKIGHDDVLAFAKMGAFEALLNGTGLIWDHYYHGLALAEAFQEVGICAVIAPTLQDLSGPGAKQHRSALKATEAIHGNSSLRASGIVAALGPHATDTVSLGLFREAGELAQALDIPLHCHLAQSLDEVERAYERHGVDPLGVLEKSGALDLAPQSLLVHGILLQERGLKALDPTRQTLALCPHSKQIFAFIPDIAAWERAGVPWLVATDCAASNDALDVQRDLRALAGWSGWEMTWNRTYQGHLKGDSGLESARATWAARQKVRDSKASIMTPSSLLSRVWGVPGALHPRQRAGIIAPGALANLIAWDLDHPAFWPGGDPIHALVFGKVSPAIYNMMTAGRWVGEGGDYHRSIWASDAYRAAREEASARLKALL